MLACCLPLCTRLRGRLGPPGGRLGTCGAKICFDEEAEPHAVPDHRVSPASGLPSAPRLTVPLGRATWPCPWPAVRAPPWGPGPPCLALTSSGTTCMRMAKLVRCEQRQTEWARLPSARTQPWFDQTPSPELRTREK